MAAATSPIAPYVQAVDHLVAVAGTRATWWNREVSSTQWFRFIAGPMSSIRNDQPMTAYMTAEVQRGLMPNVRMPRPLMTAAGRVGVIPASHIFLTLTPQGWLA